MKPAGEEGQPTTLENMAGENMAGENMAGENRARDRGAVE
jgi:hypothetical protein